MNKGKTELIIGLMSGTSVDGIDAALVSFSSDRELNVIETEFTPFDEQLKQEINLIAHSSSKPNTELAPQDYQRLDKRLAQRYAEASLNLLKKSRHAPAEITAIANHGQTVRHEPNANPPFSVQLGNAQHIADLTKITTIAQFRQGDLALGGQGAPLMPAFHDALFGNGSDDRYVLNIGGIANITCLKKPIIGFDTGPGNTLLDQWINHCLNQAYDKNGDWANSGTVIGDVLTALLKEPYFGQPFPKSTGPDYFNLSWLNNKISDLQSYRREDVQATLLALTVESIAMALEQASTYQAGTHQDSTHSGDVFVCGGGIHNSSLITLLKKRLPTFTLQDTNTIGIPADWVESVGFAWLGYCHLHNITSNLPEVTGASALTVLGERYLPSPGPVG